MIHFILILFPLFVLILFPIVWIEPTTETRLRQLHLLAAHVLSIEDGPEPLWRCSHHDSSACSTPTQALRRSCHCCCHPSLLLCLQLCRAPKWAAKTRLNVYAQSCRHLVCSWACRREDLRSRVASSSTPMPRVSPQHPIISVLILASGHVDIDGYTGPDGRDRKLVQSFVSWSVFCSF